MKKGKSNFYEWLFRRWVVTFLWKEENLYTANQCWQHLPQLVVSFRAEKVTTNTHTHKINLVLSFTWHASSSDGWNRARTDFAWSGHHGWWATPMKQQTLLWRRQKTFWVTLRAKFIPGTKKKKSLEHHLFNIHPRNQQSELAQSLPIQNKTKQNKENSSWTLFICS